MRQILRFYVRHDLDLIGLRVQGVAIGKLAKIALESYANGKRIHICVDAGRQISMDDITDLIKKENKHKSSLAKVTSFKCEFTTRDPETIKLLKNIKNTYRNQFCKTILRNTLTEQSLIPFFTKIENVNTENAFLEGINKDYIPNLIPTPMQDKTIKATDYLKSAKKTGEPKEKPSASAEPSHQKQKEESVPIKEEPAQNLDITDTPPITPIEELTVEQTGENTTLSDDSSDSVGAMFDSLIQDL